MASPLKLPIDVVSGGTGIRGKTFKWTYTTDSITGRRTIECEGGTLPSMEVALEDLIKLTKRLDAERAKLQAFKDWVHAYLDGKGVPEEFPDGSHTKEGCRIGDRLDHVFAQLEEAKVELAAWSEHNTDKDREDAGRGQRRRPK